MTPVLKFLYKLMDLAWLVKILIETCSQVPDVL